MQFYTDYLSELMPCNWKIRIFVCITENYADFYIFIDNLNNNYY